jgi:hypothetical protein
MLAHVSGSRAHWPMKRFVPGDEPGDDLPEVTTRSERMAMLWLRR